MAHRLYLQCKNRVGPQKIEISYDRMSYRKFLDYQGLRVLSNNLSLQN